MRSELLRLGLMLGFLSVPVIGCIPTVGCAPNEDKDDGKLEQMGKSLDEASKDVKDAANELEEDVKDAANDVEEDVRD